MDNSWAKHFVDTISTSGTVQVFFLRNFFFMSIIFYFLCHIFWKTWVFFYYSTLDYLWSLLHCFFWGWQFFLCKNWLPDWLVWNTFLGFAEIANILDLCIARLCFVLYCNKQWSYWHVLPLSQKVNMNISWWLLFFCVVSSYSFGVNQVVVLHLFCHVYHILFTFSKILENVSIFLVCSSFHMFFHHRVKICDILIIYHIWLFSKEFTLRIL